MKIIENIRMKQMKRKKDEYKKGKLTRKKKDACLHRIFLTGLCEF